MKKLFIKINMAVLMMCCMLFLVPLKADAAGATITLNNNGLTGSNGDFFVGYDEVMPGDRTVQTITVRNLGDHKAEIYLQAVTKAVTDQSLMDYLSITVTQAQNNNLNHASTAVGGVLSQPVLLGTFSPGQSVTLSVEMQFSQEAGNEFMNALADITWVYTAVVETPSGNDEYSWSTTPKTGDDSHIFLWSGVMLLSALLLIVLLKKRNCTTK